MNHPPSAPQRTRNATMTTASTPRRNLRHTPRCRAAAASLCLAALACAAHAADPGITCERQYTGANQQLILDVTAPRDFGKMTLALMNDDGSLVADPVEVRPGRVDLSAVLPAIWTLEHAAYLQMLDGETPVGTALVLQPLLARMVPVTEQSRRPDGSTYTRIIDWRDENTPPEEPPPVAENTGEGGTDDVPEPVEPVVVETPTQTPRLLSGLRIDPEMDAIMRTTAGEIRIRMRHDAAPNTANNFLALCAGHFYEGITFHRVVPLDRQGLPFVIQAGDPTGKGDGGPGYWLPIEPSTLPHDLGVISMARADDPDSAGSQFFFCLSRAGTARLDGQYCAFGEAVSGAETILAIATTELADAGAGRPVKPPVILDVQLVPAPPRTVGEGRPDDPISDAPPIEAPKPKRVPR